MSSNADLTVAVFDIPGLHPSELELLRHEAALLDRVWRALRDLGADAAFIEIDTNEPPSSLSGRNGRLSVAR
jgi:hypothetical protein